MNNNSNNTTPTDDAQALVRRTGQNRRIQTQECLEPMSMRTPKASRSWHRPSDLVWPHCSNTIQGPTAPSPEDPEPPSRSQGPRRSLRLKAKQRLSPRPELDPPPVPAKREG